jgi:transcriptional regulator with GAF, ATPase, and Fis domain
MGPPSNDPIGPTLTAALLTVREAARRGVVAGRFQPEVEERLLQSIVDATVRLFEAEAASIALHETDPDRLQFRVAAGPKGAGAVGMSVATTQGIAGYVFSTGESLALSDVGSDPRWDREAAERTGYIPRSIAAVPLVNDNETVGVLQVLDKHSAPSFTIRDMELLAAFASQAATAIAATRVQRDLPTLMASALRQLEPGMDEEQVSALVTEATRDLDVDGQSPFWGLVDEVSRLRDLGESELDLVGDILRVVAEHRTHRTRGRGRFR